MDLSEIRQLASQMTDEELQGALMEIRQNRRAPATPRQTSTKKKADTNKQSSLGVDALLASALSNPEMKAKLLQALTQGGKK